MHDKTNIYNMFIQILEEELIPAMGCTEPIALAFAGAKATELLGELPNRVLIQVSGSIIKNVKSVIVPNTNHLKGIPSATSAGIVAGNSSKELEVISTVSEKDVLEIHNFINNTPIEVEHINNGNVFEISVTLYSNTSYVKVVIVDFHTNIVLIEKDDNILYSKNIINADKNKRTDRSILTMDSILDFVNNLNINDVRTLLERQIKYNYAIAEEGLRNNYGANIGNVLLKSNGTDIRTRAKAMAAAGSDARMNGCELPVVINSGSGNQGITCSVPVIEYGKELNVSEDTLFRALALSNLTAIHQKTEIGTLSAYCGAVSAAAGAITGIGYLQGATLNKLSHTIENTLAIVSGMVCDGAKASCAAKITSSLDAAFLGYDMCSDGQHFNEGDGLVGRCVETTIKNIGRLAKEGMHATNEEVLKIMIGR